MAKRRPFDDLTEAPPLGSAVFLRSRFSRYLVRLSAMISISPESRNAQTPSMATAMKALVSPLSNGKAYYRKCLSPSAVANENDLTDK
jgi:hypothetical protein